MYPSIHHWNGIGEKQTKSFEKSCLTSQSMRREHGKCGNCNYIAALLIVSPKKESRSGCPFSEEERKVAHETDCGTIPI